VGNKESYLSHFYILRSSFAIIMILTNLKFDSNYFSNIHKIIKIKKNYKTFTQGYQLLLIRWRMLNDQPSFLFDLRKCPMEKFGSMLLIFSVRFEQARRWKTVVLDQRYNLIVSKSLSRKTVNKMSGRVSWMCMNNSTAIFAR